MKSLKYFLGFAFLLVLAAGCKKETYDDVSFVDTANSPDQLSVLFEITQDNTGRVTITPNGARCCFRAEVRVRVGYRVGYAQSTLAVGVHIAPQIIFAFDIG